MCCKYIAMYRGYFDIIEINIRTCCIACQHSCVRLFVAPVERSFLFMNHSSLLSLAHLHVFYINIIMAEIQTRKIKSITIKLKLTFHDEVIEALSTNVGIFLRPPVRIKFPVQSNRILTC